MTSWNDVRQAVEEKAQQHVQQGQQREAALVELKQIIGEARQNLDLLRELDQWLVLCDNVLQMAFDTVKASWLVMNPTGQIYMMRPVKNPGAPYVKGTHLYEEIRDDGVLRGALLELLGDHYTSEDLKRVHEEEMVRLTNRHPIDFIPYYAINRHE